MRPYNPAETFARLIDKLYKGKEFAHDGGQTITAAVMVSKGITLLSQRAIFNDDIQ